MTLLWSQAPARIGTREKRSEAIRPIHLVSDWANRRKADDESEQPICSSKYDDEALIHGCIVVLMSVLPLYRRIRYRSRCLEDLAHEKLLSMSFFVFFSKRLTAAAVGPGGQETNTFN